MNRRKPDDETVEQLKALGYLPDGAGEKCERPLLICDVDEVVLHLVDPFAQVLRERGFELKSRSFKLTGNIFDIETGREASREEVWAGLAQLFGEQANRQHLVDGAIGGLNRISDQIDILFLTNMPHEFREIRTDHLKRNGLDHPLVTNTGSKMPAIDIVKKHRRNTIGFIDDTPKNLEHVRDGAPDIHLFHFMANDEFRNMVGAIDGTHISSGDWSETSDKICQVLIENRA